MTKNSNLYFNVVCEEMGMTGGKIIHINKNLGINEIHEFFWGNVYKYPNAKWEIYLNGISFPISTVVND